MFSLRSLFSQSQSTEPVPIDQGSGAAPATVDSTGDKADMLASQVAREAHAIKNAPVVTPGPPAGRCHFCGAVSRELVFAHAIEHPREGMIQRYRGVDCCGGGRFQL